MNRLLANFRNALVSIVAQRSRMGLNALGISVASLAIVTLVSIAIGVRSDVTRQIQSLGVNLLIVLPGRFEPGQFNPNLGGQSFLREDYAKDLRNLPGIRLAAPLTFAGGGLEYNGKSAYPTIVAATSDWFSIHPVEMKSGVVWRDPLSTDDVVVLGSVAAEQIFGKADPLGQNVTINDRKYRVIGVTKDAKTEGSLFSMFALQNVVYIPYHAVKAHTPDMQTDRIMIQTFPDAEPKSLVKNVEARLGQKMAYQQYSVLTQEDLLGLVYKLMSILTWLVTGLTSIALVVGGVGIMTVMLMSVNERIKEIGIRKTTGATQKDVFQQFLSEAILISAAGGLVGLAVSYAVCLALYHYTPVKPQITPSIIALCFGVCLGVGAVFGLIPAVSAARKDPVAAIRNE